MVYGAWQAPSIEVPCFLAAIETSDARILVDTGFRDPVYWSSLLTRHSQMPSETVDKALRALGWEPSAVDIVINTHLHYDHADNNRLFSSARFFVSQTEWHAAARPILTQTVLYRPTVLDEMQGLAVELVSEDPFLVVDGISLISTPGHSLGHQSVLVDTDEGVVCVTGDAGYLRENFETGVPPGVSTSIVDGIASLTRICSLSDRLFINHSPEMKPGQHAGFPATPQLRNG